MQTVPQAPAPDNTLLARYATYTGLPGYAIRTADRRVFFIDSDAQCTPLDNSHLPHLVLLGDVNTAERQSIEDLMKGGYAAMACSRQEGVQ